MLLKKADHFVHPVRPGRKLIRHAEPDRVHAEAVRHVHPPMSVFFTWLELWRIRGDVPTWSRVERVPLAAHVGTLH